MYRTSYHAYLDSGQVFILSLALKNVKAMTGHGTDVSMPTSDCWQQAQKVKPETKRQWN